MLSMEKGKNIQRGISLVMVISFFLNWYNVAFDAGGYFTVSEPMNGITIAVMYKLLLIPFICALVSVWVSFKNEQEDVKKIKLGRLSEVSFLVTIFVILIRLPPWYDHRAMIGFYLFLGLCVVQILIAYKAKKEGK